MKSVNSLLPAIGLVVVTLFLSFQTSAQTAGAVYGMTNDTDANSIVAYNRNTDGTIDLIGEFATGGQGGIFDGGEGLDPLISAYSVLLTDDNRFLLAVNAGSSTVSVLRVNADNSLTLTDQRAVPGAGPNSIATQPLGRRSALVYVSVIDADGEFTGPPDNEGALIGFRLTPRGRLIRLRRSFRPLPARPAAIQFSPDGRFLIATQFNAGAAALPSGNADEVLVYRLRRNGRLSFAPVSVASSSLPFAASGRNLPSAIGLEVVENDGAQYVVVSEAREFQNDGAPPAFFELQTGSVSTWELGVDGSLSPISQDVLAGSGFLDGQRTTCWLEFSADGETLWSVNSLDASISAFSFDNGQVSLIEELAAVGNVPDNSSPGAAFGSTDGFIDVWLSDDGEYLYQMLGLAGTINVYSVSGGLNLVQSVTDLPLQNIQGIVAF